jgi:hypothetical protein
MLLGVGMAQYITLRTITLSQTEENPCTVTWTAFACDNVKGLYTTTRTFECAQYVCIIEVNVSVFVHIRKCLGFPNSLFVEMCALLGSLAKVWEWGGLSGNRSYMLVAGCMWHAEECSHHGRTRSCLMGSLADMPHTTVAVVTVTVGERTCFSCGI